MRDEHRHACTVLRLIEHLPDNVVTRVKADFGLAEHRHLASLDIKPVDPGWRVVAGVVEKRLRVVKLARKSSRRANARQIHRSCLLALEVKNLYDSLGVAQVVSDDLATDEADAVQDICGLRDDLAPVRRSRDVNVDGNQAAPRRVFVGTKIELSTHVANQRVIVVETFD